ncbi:WXG100 family type VII secretion target [Dactylosporangium sp. CA-233914]|uniref:WXG100 family type VII secretion target n=1 Tax=Dactylosporangium sp. CA-233914 TaxID=3239934 RepID=UPI003D94CD5D
MVSTDMQSQGSILLGKAEAIDADLAALLTRLQALQEFWQSPAANEFQPFFQNWHNAAAALFGPGGTLGQISNALNITWNNYTECETANMRGWQAA